MVLVLCVSLLVIAACGDESSSLDAGGASAVVAGHETGSGFAPFVSSAELIGRGIAYPRPAAAAQRLRDTSGGGCGELMPKGFSAGQTVLQTIVSGGMKRTYRVHVPSGASTTEAMPLVLNFHGRSGTGIDQEITSGLVPISNREGFVLVSPDGTGTPMGWSAGATEPNNVDDIRFTEDVLDAVMSQLCIDAARVYATGFSNGAFMSSRLACEIPDRIAAVVAVGGAHFPEQSCKSKVPVLAVHGTADTIVPIDGGTVRQWHYGGAYEAMENWAASNGCGTAAPAIAVADGVTLRAFSDCGAATELLTIDGCEHLWPGYPGVQAGSPAARLSGGELVWGFLSAKRIPRS